MRPPDEPLVPRPDIDFTFFMEPPFTGLYWDHHEDGVYRCVRCEAPLFDSADKIDIGAGVATYGTSAARGAVIATGAASDASADPAQCCGKCGLVLGHWVDAQGGTEPPHYLVSSAALDFEPRGN
jgi:peptide-methionine (R)-S-oxide reductase